MRGYAQRDDVVHLRADLVDDGLAGASNADTAHRVTLEDQGTQPQPDGVIAALLPGAAVLLSLMHVRLAVWLAASTGARRYQGGAARGIASLLRVRHV